MMCQHFLLVIGQVIITRISLNDMPRSGKGEKSVVAKGGDMLAGIEPICPAINVAR